MFVTTRARRQTPCTRSNPSANARFIASVLEFVCSNDAEGAGFRLPVEVKRRWGESLRAGWRTFGASRRGELREWIGDYAEFALAVREAENAREAVAYLDDGLVR